MIFSDCDPQFFDERLLTSCNQLLSLFFDSILELDCIIYVLWPAFKQHRRLAAGPLSACAGRVSAETILLPLIYGTWELNI